MRTYIWIVVAAAVAVSLSLGVATATAAGSNSANVQNSNSQGQDSNNQGQNNNDQGQGQKPACTAGSDNFSGDANGSRPMTFSGGKINTAYGPNGGIYIDGLDWNPGYFASGTYVDFTGVGNTFRLTFTSAVNSVQLQAQSPFFDEVVTLTLTAYDASNHIVGSDSQTGSFFAPTLNVSSATNNIKSFTIATDDPYNTGVGFSNIVWTCA